MNHTWCRHGTRARFLRPVRLRSTRFAAGLRDTRGRIGGHRHCGVVVLLRRATQPTRGAFAATNHHRFAMDAAHHRCSRSQTAVDETFSFGQEKREAIGGFAGRIDRAPCIHQTHHVSWEDVGLLEAHTPPQEKKKRKQRIEERGSISARMRWQKVNLTQRDERKLATKTEVLEERPTFMPPVEEPMTVEGRRPTKHNEITLVLVPLQFELWHLGVKQGWLAPPD